MRITITLAASLLAATVLAGPGYAQQANQECTGENCPPAAATPQDRQPSVTEQAPAIRQGETEPKTEHRMQTAEPAPKPHGEQPADSQAAAPKTEDDSQSAEKQAAITTDQKAEIKTVIREEVRVEPQRVDIDINIGVGVPQTVVLHPLPPSVVALVPAYRGYLFFVLADGTIVIVAPDTREIVYLIA